MYSIDQIRLLVRLITDSRIVLKQDKRIYLNPGQK
jgi:hypothetical protein